MKPAGCGERPQAAGGGGWLQGGARHTDRLAVISSGADRSDRLQRFFDIQKTAAIHRIDAGRAEIGGGDEQDVRDLVGAQ
jgi:hypothetical protein